MDSKKIYKVYHSGAYIGSTAAVSPEKAISSVRYRCGMMYAPMSEFKAKAEKKSKAG